MSENWQEAIPNNWLAEHEEAFKALTEKLTITLILSQAIDQNWQGSLKTPEEFTQFFESEAKKHNRKVEEIRGYFVEAGAKKAREQLFEEHFGDKIPRDEKGNPLVPKKTLMRLVHRF